MPQNRERHGQTRIGLVAVLLFSLGACGAESPESAPTDAGAATGATVDETPPSPPAEAAELPEFHGAYWLSEGEWKRLPTGEENRLVVPPDVRLLLFDVSIASGFGSMVRGPVRYRFLRYAVDAASPSALRTGSGGRRVFRSDKWETGEYVEVRTRPVEGQPGMLELIPAKPLAPGRYRWDVSRPRVWLEVRGESDDAATFDKFKKSYFPPAELDSVLAELEREADQAGRAEGWTKRALTLQRVLPFRPDDAGLKFEIALAKARAAKRVGSASRAATFYREAAEHMPSRRAEVEPEIAEVLAGERLDKFVEEAFERKRSGVRTLRIDVSQIPAEVRALPGFDERLRRELRTAVRANAQAMASERYRPLPSMVAIYQLALELHRSDQVAQDELRAHGTAQAAVLVADLIGNVEWGRVNTDNARAAVAFGAHDRETLLQVADVVAQFAANYLERNPNEPEDARADNDRRLAEVMGVLELVEGFPVAPDDVETLRAAAARTSVYWRLSRREKDLDRARWWESWEGCKPKSD